MTWDVWTMYYRVEVSVALSETVYSSTESSLIVSLAFSLEMF